MKSPYIVDIDYLATLISEVTDSEFESVKMILELEPIILMSEISKIAKEDIAIINTPILKGSISKDEFLLSVSKKYKGECIRRLGSNIDRLYGTISRRLNYSIDEKFKDLIRQILKENNMLDKGDENS